MHRRTLRDGQGRRHVHRRTRYEILSQNQDEQVKAISALCGTAKAKCQFTSTRKEDTFSAEHPVGGITENRGDGVLTKTLTVTDTTSTTTNLKIAAKVSFDVLKVVKAELSTEYGIAWAETHTFTETQDFPVQPGYRGWIVGQTPITRYYGDMRITVGNTTVTVKDMYVDSPRPIGQAVFKPRTSPLTTPPPAAL